MIERLKDALGESKGGSPRADGGQSVTADDDSDSPDSQYQLGTSDWEDARTETEQEASVEPSSEIDQEASAEPPPEIDQVFEILKNQRRRYVLEYLTMVDDQVRLGELAEQIAAWEYEKDVRAISSQERKRVYVGLYQCHLPKMDDVGAISYNKPRGKIKAGANIGFFERYLPIEKSTTEQPGTVRSVAATVSRFFGRE